MGITNGYHLICIWMNLVTGSQGWVNDVGMVGLRRKGSSWDQVWTQPQEVEQLDEWRWHFMGDPETKYGDSSVPGESKDEARSATQLLLSLRAKGWPGRRAQDSSITSGKAVGKAQRDSCPAGLAYAKKANSLKLRAACLSIVAIFLQLERELAFIKHPSCSLSSQELLLHPTDE